MKLSKETLKTIIKEELEAALEEGYKGMQYKRNPSLRPDYKGTGGPNPDYPRAETEEHRVEQMKAIAAMIRRQTGKDVTIKIDGQDVEK